MLKLTSAGPGGGSVSDARLQLLAAAMAAPDCRLEKLFVECRSYMSAAVRLVECRCAARGRLFVECRCAAREAFS